MSVFEIRDNFYLDGKPFQIISGSIHYFRVVPQYWRDRLQKLLAMGCNTVETYIPWNFHEPRKGRFRFDGMADVEGFVRLAQELGLYAYLFPMSENAFVCSQCRRQLQRIREYDSQNRTSLEQTARVYVQEKMEIAATAKALFQHPNTVRYRLTKIQKLMDMEDDAMFAPMIGSIAFVGYIFRLDEGADVDAFMQTLRDNADPSWNICVTAEETVIDAVGNTVFFVMTPGSAA